MPGKAKLPKTIAGLKVPKAFRNAGWLDSLVGSPEGRELLAEALLKAAEAAAAVLTQRATDSDEAVSDEAGTDVPGGDAAPDEEEAPASAPRPRARRRSRRGAEAPTEGEDQTAAPSAET